MYNYNSSLWRQLLAVGNLVAGERLLCINVPFMITLYANKNFRSKKNKRHTGIGPAYSAWEAGALPLC